MMFALRFLPYAVSGLAVAAVWWLWADRAALQAENAAQARELVVQAHVLEQAAVARDVARAEAARMAEKAAEFDNIREFILRGPNDEPLPDALRDILDRLFATNSD